MSPRRAWLLGGALVALAVALVVDLGRLAWPPLDRAALLTTIGCLALLGLGQALLARFGAVDLAAGAAIGLVAALVTSLAPSMGLVPALLGALLVSVTASLSQTGLARRWVGGELPIGLAACLLLLAATPDNLGRLAPEPLRAMAQEPAFATVPWALVGAGLGLLLAAVLARRLSWPLASLAAGAIWWFLGLLAAGRPSGENGLFILWTVQGLAVARLAGADLDLPALGLAAIGLGVVLHLAQPVAWVVSALALLLAVASGQSSMKRPVSMDS